MGSPASTVTPTPLITMKNGIELAQEYTSIIAGKTLLVTGVSPGTLGSTFVKTAAKHKPSVLILAGRSLDKVQKTIDELKADDLDAGIVIKPLELDLSSLSAVRAAADKVNSWDDVPHIDVLVNNAGIMAVDYAVSPDGFESQLATNHLGPFLFTNLIMPKVLAAAAPRIVNVSSDGHCLCPFRFYDYNFHEGETYNRWRAYGQSKTANILMALSLAQKLGKTKNLLAFSLHPGAIMSHLADHLDLNAAYPELLEAYKVLGHPEGWREAFPLISFEEGVATHFLTSFDPNVSENNGAYFDKGALADAWSGQVQPWATDLISAERLWKLSEKLVGQEFPY